MIQQNQKTNINNCVIVDDDSLDEDSLNEDSLDKEDETLDIIKKPITNVIYNKVIKKEKNSPSILNKWFNEDNQ